MPDIFVLKIMEVIDMISYTLCNFDVFFRCKNDIIYFINLDYFSDAKIGCGQGRRKERKERRFKKRRLFKKPKNY